MDDMIGFGGDRESMLRAAKTVRAEVRAGRWKDVTIVYDDEEVIDTLAA